MAFVFRVAITLSIVSYIVFASIVLGRRLVRTTHMNQVFCLCSCDCLVCIWEFISCASLVRFDGLCVDNCDLFLPVLRVLQGASILWTLQIAISMAFVIRGWKMPKKRWSLMIWPSALLLSLPLWITTIAGKWEHVADTKFCTAAQHWNPDLIWASLVTTIIGVMCLVYAYSVWRLWRIYNTVIARKLRHVFFYVLVFLVCYSPYVFWNGFWRIEEKYGGGTHTTPFFYQVFYLCYASTGFCNVAAYGYNHWDTGCWRSRIRARQSAGVHVVMFASNRESRFIQPSTSGTGTTETVTGSEHGSVDEVRMSLPDDVGRGPETIEEYDTVVAADDYGCFG